MMKIKDIDGKQHLIPTELVELIRSKPEVTYLMLRMTCEWLIVSTQKEQPKQELLDTMIWDFISQYNAHTAPPPKPEEIN